MINFDSKNKYGYEDLCRIIAILRSPEGCPWDRAQTHGSVKREFIEEAYEACEAIDEGDKAHLCEELGDVLMQVVFHADMERETGGFDMDDVCDGICKKLLRRHPHVFGGVSVSGTDEVLQNWDAIKRQEHGHSDNASVLDSVARSLPALWRAEKLQKKAQGFGYGDFGAGAASDRLRKSADVLLSALSGGEDPGSAVGGLLFDAVCASRLLGVDPENALGQACERFIESFRAAERTANSNLSGGPVPIPAGSICPDKEG